MSVENLAQIWPEWEIEKQLGRGSYGVVYKAVRRDNNVESHAAIKVISIPSDESEVDSLRSEGLDMDGTRTYFKGIVDDFVSEIQLMESLKGIQNIVSVEDYKVVERTDSIGWDIYIRMELLTPFNTFVCDKKLSEKDVIKLGIDICTALEICGQRNIIHRDIKPENIFVNDFGYFKLGDFGIARKLENMTGGLSQKGTFNYMAPEVANSNTYDARVDTYSLGIVLYRLLNGNRLPFLDTEKQLLNPNERKNAVERRIRGEELPAPCEASAEMANLILRACAYNPDMRFSSATAMKEALIGVGNGTYVPIVADLDKTTAVRHAQADYDATTAVRKAPQAAGTPVQNNASSKNEAVPTFGKKKSKAPKIIAIVLVLALLIGGVFVAYPYVSDLLSNNTSDNGDMGNPEDNTTDSTNGDETGNPGDNTGLTDDEKIQAIIGDAEKLANNNYLDKAIDKIEEGLVTYPNSVELQTKLDEYNAKLAQQDKQKVLDDAAALAGKGDYLGAMRKIEAAHKAVPDDVDYEIAYYNYCGAYEDSIIEQADELAKNGDYTGAIALIETAQVNVKDSSKFSDKLSEYKEAITVSDPDEYLYNLQHTNYDHSGHTSNQFFLINGKVTSFLGDTYTEGLLFKRGKKTSTSITYDLDAQYSVLTGRISMIKTGNIQGIGSFESQADDLVWLEFYADGERIYNEKVYTSPRTNPTMDIDFSINLEGVKTLTIKIVPDNEDRYSGTNNCIALTGLGLYESGKTPEIKEVKADSLLDLQHTEYEHNGHASNKLFLINGKAVSSLGETFNEGLLFKRGKRTSTSITYNLNAQYSALTGTISMITSGNVLSVGSFTSETKDLVCLEFYADGEKIYTSPRTNPTMDMDFNINLEGVKTLTIKIVPDDEDRYSGTNNCIALTGLELYESGTKPTVDEVKVDSLLEIQHTEYNHNGHSSNKLFLINGKVTTSLGETYNEGLLFKRGKRTSTSITYNLNAQYSALTGKISMVTSGNVLSLGSFTSETKDLVCLEFYADGEKIYTSPRTNPTMDMDFNINLEGVKTLTIKIVPDDEDRYSGTNNCIALTGLKLS